MKAIETWNMRAKLGSGKYIEERIVELEQKIEDLKGMLGELPPEGKCAMLLVQHVNGEYKWACEKYDFASYCLVDSEADTYTGMTLNDTFGRADFADKLAMAKQLRRMADELNAELGSGTCELVDCGICKFYHADIQFCEYGIPPCPKFERKAVKR